MGRSIAAKKEATYGATFGTDATLFSSLISETVSKNVAFEDIAPVRSNSIMASNLLTESHGGDIELLGSYDDEVGIFFLGFFGSAEPVSGIGPYTTLFPAVAGTSGRLGTSLAVEISRDSAALTARYIGSKVVGFRYSASLSQSPQLGFSIMAKDAETGSASALSVPSFNPLTVADTTLSFDGGATTAKVQSLSVTASWPVDEPHVMGDAKYAVEPIDSDFLTVEGEATIILEDLTEFAKLDGTTAVDIEVKTTNGTGVFQLDMKNSRYASYGWNVSGKDRLTASVAWKSIFNATADENLLVTLTGADATDYDSL